jgi:membrane protein DedA with SNARE-associated domain
MPWRRFLFWNTAGGVAWATAVGLLAYFGGKALADTIGSYGIYAAIAIAAAAAVFLGASRLSKRRGS